MNFKIKDANDDDESDAISDSEPSEDNLDDDQILKLIPKKYGKQKFIKGIEIQKKKVVPPPVEKVPKKPKAQLMPCMSSKKDKTSRNPSEGPVKKTVVVNINIFKQVVTKLRNGGKQRDVGTQIRYLGDGKNLSLMELDILRHTGYKWSKIIYPGFKGNVKPFLDKAELFRSADKFEREGAFNPNGLSMSSPLCPMQNTFMS